MDNGRLIVYTYTIIDTVFTMIVAFCTIIYYDSTPLMDAVVVELLGVW